VQHTKRREFARLVEGEALADIDRAPAQQRVILVGQHRKVRPDLPVEDVRADQSEGLGGGVHLDRPVDQVEQIVGHEGQAADVVEMAVRQEHAADAALLAQAQITDAGAGIDEKFVIDEQTGGPQTRTDAAATAEDLDPHAWFWSGYGRRS
jgi:hypothetical protein